eukprot:1909440-Amphidinium_carterae.6
MKKHGNTTFSQDPSHGLLPLTFPNATPQKIQNIMKQTAHRRVPPHVCALLRPLCVLVLSPEKQGHVNCDLAPLQSCGGGHFDARFRKKRCHARRQKCCAQLEHLLHAFFCF